MVCNTTKYSWCCDQCVNADGYLFMITIVIHIPMQSSIDICVVGTAGTFCQKCGKCLTHWGRVTHICVSKFTIIGSDNGLSPGRRKTIIWTNAKILLIGPIRTNFGEILIKIHSFSCKENVLENTVRKMAAILSRPHCVKCNDWNIFVEERKLSTHGCLNPTMT